MKVANWNSFLLLLTLGFKVQQILGTDAAPPTVAVIGCGPSGMSLLHAIATKRKQGIKNLPQVVVYEKHDSCGGVWRSDRHTKKQSASSKTQEGTCLASANSNSTKDECTPEIKTTAMYEGLWINSHKDAMEFMDYTFQEHYNNVPQPVFLPRQQVLEYIMKRVTIHEDIFQYVRFETAVNYVSFDEEEKKFEITSTDINGEVNVEMYDKCVWAVGINGKPFKPKEVLEALKNYQGIIVHSSEIDALFGSVSTETKAENAVKGKRMLFIGDAYSAEDLALQCIKMGVEIIYISSRRSKGVASEMGSWPGDKVEMIYYSQVKGVGNDESGKTITFKSLNDDYPSNDIENIDFVVLCTGFEANLDMLADHLQPEEVDDNDYWKLEDFGIDTNEWQMRDNTYVREIGHVTPSVQLGYYNKKQYWSWSAFRNLILIDNPNMFFLHETSEEFPLLSIDINAWEILAYIMNEKTIPSKEDIWKQNELKMLGLMHEVTYRVDMDDNFIASYNSLPNSSSLYHANSKEYTQLMREYAVFETDSIIESMHAGNYLGIGSLFGEKGNLSSMGLQFSEMVVHSLLFRPLLQYEKEEQKLWKTFRDYDSKFFKSYVTGMESVPLKGRWLDLDDKGNPIPTE
ncbi:hypothetical protein CTEN210_18239 [Chaetoceros tenuissimus]|uniref:Uncharacterized protein n=1 Tax=Chaetoceros tenuissimus TaxID=426638 RepID=A0AAD3DCB7_9STRA|nr:hypothetical protein CTEN210_18239 [Chaetoceros tenuissimus]